MDPFSNLTNDTTLEPRCPVPVRTLGIKIGEAIGYSLILILGVLGNSVVIAIVYKNRSMRTPANYFIANMAFADLCVPIFLVPSSLVRIFEGSGVWLLGGKLGLLLCKLTPFVYDVCLMVSIHSLVLVAFERFYAVVRPLKAAIRNSRRCVAIIAATWLLAILFHANYFYCLRLVSANDKTYCIYTWSPAIDTKVVIEKTVIPIILAFYVFPLGSITILYCLIVLKLKKQKIPGTRYGNMIVNRQKRIVNTFRMVMTVVLAFFICWTPSKVYALLVIYYWDWQVPCYINSDGLLLAIYIIAFSNNAITPYIYFVFNENYRNGLKGLLPWYEKPLAVYSFHLGHGQSRSSSLRSGLVAGTRVSIKQPSSDGESGSALKPARV